MGNFYVNHTVIGATAEAVAKAMADRSAFIVNAGNDYVVVYDAECDSQDQDAITELSQKISSELNKIVFAVLNHDDDILYFQLVQNGEVIDEYDSAPGYFDGEDTGPTGGNATKLADAFDIEDELGIERVLRGEYAFAVHRHQALCEALNLPVCAVGFGFRYLDEGEIPEDLTEEEILRIG